MMNTDPDICPGTVNPDEPAWGPLAWIGGSSPCVCYCPYSLRQAYDAAHKTNLCANVHCYDKCENSYEFRSGACNPDTGECDYGTENYCDYDCDGSFCADAPEDINPPQDEITPPATTNDNNPPPASKEDKCENVNCDPKCEGTVSKTNGNCNANTGKCVYTENNCYELGCNPDNFLCNVNSKVAGRIYYTDYTGALIETVPLKNIIITFAYTTPEGKVVRNFNTQITYTDADGNFEYENAEMMQPGNKITAYVYFMNQGRNFFITIDSDRDQPFNLALVKDVDSTDPSLQIMDFDLFNSEDYPYGRDFAKIYQYIQKAVAFKENYIGLGSTIQERVRLFSNDGTWHSPEYNSDKSSTGIAILYGGSSYETFDAPTNREFHEYCHHIHAETLGAVFQKAGCDHCGYFENPTTAWGLVEGWAEYCSLEMKKYYNMGSEGNYEVDDTVWNLEYDYKLDSEEQPTTAEELAIAGIMLDLTDSGSDYSDGKDDDPVSLPFSTVWSAFTKRMDFGDGNGARPPLTLRDFYTSLISITGESKGIDQVFTNHNAFQDYNGNGARDSEEPIGYSGKSTDLRMDLTSEPGTSISISGAQGGFAKVSVQMTGDKGRSYSFMIPVRNGKVALPMPPKDYPATITVTALDKSTNTLASNSFETTTEQIYQKINPGSDFGTYSVSGFSAASCSQDYQCISWNLGNKCSNGNCILEQKSNPVPSETNVNLDLTGSNGTSTGSGSDAACCGGPAAIAFVVSIALLRGRKED
jgi:hypothetical protein